MLCTTPPQSVSKNMTCTSVWMRGTFSFIAVRCAGIGLKPKPRMTKIQELGKRREILFGFRIFPDVFEISTFGVGFSALKGEPDREGTGTRDKSFRARNT